MQNQTYLIRRGAIYHFRVKVPTDLRDQLSQKHEITRTLRTKDRREAERRLPLEIAKVRQQFQQLRASASPVRHVEELRPEDIERLKAQWLHEWLDSDEQERAAGLTHAAYENTETVLLHFTDIVGEGLINGNTNVVEASADQLLASDGIKLNKNAHSYKRLCYGLLQAMSDALRLIADRQNGKAVPTPRAPDAAAGAREVLDELLDYWKTQVSRKPKTVHEFTTAVRRFTELHGNMPAADIEKRHMVAFKDKLIAEGLAQGTVKKQLGALSAVLQLAVDNEKLPLNPARGVRLPKLKVEKKARTSFDAGDLQRIFSAPVFLHGIRPEAGAGEAAYWVPIIALFTGARLTEIGQLRVADVKREDRIQYFDITDEGEESGIKTESSRRRVPIHPELMRLGLLKYVADMQNRGEERLFPEIKPDRMGVLTGNWSKWWGRYMRKVIGIYDKRKVFHSFRHTFKDACRTAGIGQEIHDALTGHADGDNEGRGYGAGQHPLRPLAAAIKKVSYPGLKLV